MRPREVSTSARGPVGVDQAWERYADPSRWADWAPHLRRVEVDGVAADGTVRLHPGMSGRVHGSLGLAVDFVVTAVDEPARTWSWTVRLVRPVPGPFRLDLHHTLETVGEGGGGDGGDTGEPAGGTARRTEAGLVLRGPAPVVLAYRPVARWALRRLVT